MKKQTKYTVGLVLGILIIAFIVLIVQRTFFTVQPKYAVVTVDTKELMRLDLSEDTVETVETSYGYRNVITVKDGKVSVTESNCENQICVNEGEISESYELIVCLPHGLVVTIEDPESEK